MWLWAGPVAGDNCGVAGVTNDAPASYPLGTNLVTWTVADASGNTNSCQQHGDRVGCEAATIVWYLTNVVMAADTNCQAAMPEVTGTNYIIALDTCSSVTVTQSVATNTVLNLGTNEVVLGAFDAAGNAAYCTNYVLVLDQTPPWITCPVDLSVASDPGQTVPWRELPRAGRAGQLFGGGHDAGGGSGERVGVSGGQDDEHVPGDRCCRQQCGLQFRGDGGG